jgi:hypothetical protein
MWSLKEKKGISECCVCNETKACVAHDPELKFDGSSGDLCPDCKPFVLFADKELNCGKKYVHGYTRPIK